MDTGTMLIYGALGLLFLLTLLALFAPIRRIFKLAVHMAFGFFGLLICNVFGSLLGVTVGVNLVNTLVVAVLGPAGAVLLLLLGWTLT